MPFTFLQKVQMSAVKKNANKRLFYVNGWVSLLKQRSGKYILFTAFEERLNKLLNNFLNYLYLS